LLFHKKKNIELSSSTHEDERILGSRKEKGIKESKENREAKTCRSRRGGDEALWRNQEWTQSEKEGKEVLELGEKQFNAIAKEHRRQGKQCPRALSGPWERRGLVRVEVFVRRSTRKAIIMAISTKSRPEQAHCGGSERGMKQAASSREAN